MQRAALPALLMQGDVSPPAAVEEVGGLLGATTAEKRKLDDLTKEVAKLRAQMAAMTQLAIDFYSDKLRDEEYKARVPYETERAIRELEIQFDVNLTRDEKGYLTGVPTTAQPYPDTLKQHERSLKKFWGAQDSLEKSRRTFLLHDRL